MNFSPFFINSDFITNTSSLCDYKTFMNAIAGNTGNSYITWALLKELGVRQLKDEYHIQCIYEFDFSKTGSVAEFVNKNCTHVFLILQDQLRIEESYGYQLPYEGIKNLLEKIHKPVIVAGLGANCFTGFDTEFYKKLKPSTVDFMHYLSGRCLELGVRGSYTAEVLNQLGIKNAVPIGCPSFYEMGRERILTKKRYLSPDKIFFTQNLSNSLCEKNFTVCQDHQEREIINLIAFGKLGELYKNEAVMQKYARKRYRVFSSISEWKEFASNFDFAVGYRVHGSILALNSGCIPLCCNGDSRAREMCELMKIPLNGTFSPESDLFEVYENIDVSELNASYPKLYDNFASFIMRNCGVDISESLTAGLTPESCTLKLYKDYNEIVSESLLKNQFEQRRESERKADELSAKLSNMSATIEKQNAIIEEQNATINEQNSTINN